MPRAACDSCPTGHMVGGPVIDGHRRNDLLVCDTCGSVEERTDNPVARHQAKARAAIQRARQADQARNTEEIHRS